MRFPLVMKFGGAGLADGAAVRRACTLVQEVPGPPPILVVSAHGGVTAELERCAERAVLGEFDLEALRIRHKSLIRELGLEPELLDRLLGELGQVLYAISDRRRIFAEEMDFVLSFGERMSARVVAAALREAGIPATPVDAYDLGLTTDSCHGDARPLPGLEGSLRRSLEEIAGIPVVTGFLAKDGRGNLTTLGRNGSDLTASLVARSVGARRLVFWKPVAGIMDGDPDKVPTARVLTGMSMLEASAMAFHGAGVLHPSTLQPLLDTEVTIEVRDVRSPDAPGTRLDHRESSARPVAVTGIDRLEGLRVRNDGGEAAANLFALLHINHVRPRYLKVAVDAVTLYAPSTPGFQVLRRELSERAESLPQLASVVLIGAAKQGVGLRALEVLGASGVDPVYSQLDADGQCQLFLVEANQQAIAAEALHREWFALESPSSAPG